LLPSGEAVELLNEAVEAARRTNLPWEDKPISLKPSAELLKLVQQSQIIGMKQGPDAS
jgi:hypothetical protein